MTSSIPTEYEYLLNKPSWLIDGALTGTTIPCESGPGSNEGELPVV